jgi:CRAL/TRIO domain
MTSPSKASESTYFPSTCGPEPQILNVTFASDPSGSLGAQLVNCDKGNASEGDAGSSNSSDQVMFLPGFAVVGKLLAGETVARKAGVRIGDVIVAVNGHGFRRFSPDYDPATVEYLQSAVDELTTVPQPLPNMDHMVVAPGTGYDIMLTKIKAMKAAASSGDGADNPLILTLERYGWDARPNSWNRYLKARDNNVLAAMQMIQNHEAWKLQYFPIDLKSPGLQKILRTHAVSEIQITEANEFSDGKPPEEHPPTVYVDYGKLLSMQTSGEITADDVVAAFVIFTERMLATAPDPRHPLISQFIDLSGVSITSGFRVDTLKKIYNVFEPNYPEALHKMIMFPVSTIMVSICQFV